MHGTTISNEEEFTDVKYTKLPNSTSKMVSSKCFMSIDELADGVYQIQHTCSKSKINLSTAIVIGFTIL